MRQHHHGFLSVAVTWEGPWLTLEKQESWLPFSTLWCSNACLCMCGGQGVRACTCVCVCMWRGTCAHVLVGETWHSGRHSCHKQLQCPALLWLVVWYPCSLGPGSQVGRGLVRRNQPSFLSSKMACTCSIHQLLSSKLNNPCPYNLSL